MILALAVLLWGTTTARSIRGPDPTGQAWIPHLITATDGAVPKYSSTTTATDTSHSTTTTTDTSHGTTTSTDTSHTTTNTTDTGHTTTNSTDTHGTTDPHGADAVSHEGVASTNWDVPTNTVPIAPAVEIAASIINHDILDVYLVLQATGYIIVGLSYGPQNDAADAFFIEPVKVLSRDGHSIVDGIKMESCFWQATGVLSNCTSHEEGGPWILERVHINVFTKNWVANIRRNITQTSRYPWTLDVPYWVYEYGDTHEREADWATNKLVISGHAEAFLGSIFNWSWVLPSALLCFLLGV